MNRDEVKKAIIKSRVIAVLRAESPEIAREIAHAYIEAGLGTIELTTSIPGWETALEKVVADHTGDAIIGLGTVTSAIDAIQAISIGAEYIVSPFTSQDIIEAVNVRSVPVIPGASTPTEIWTAYDYGADMVKIFPAASLGGPKHIKALLAPMPHWELIPTGGVTPENAMDYFRAGAVAVGLGANMAPGDLLGKRDWDGITESVSGFLGKLTAQLEEEGL